MHRALHLRSRASLGTGVRHAQGERDAGRREDEVVLGGRIATQTLPQGKGEVRQACRQIGLLRIGQRCRLARQRRARHRPRTGPRFAHPSLCPCLHVDPRDVLRVRLRRAPRVGCCYVLHGHVHRVLRAGCRDVLPGVRHRVGWVDDRRIRVDCRRILLVGWQRIRRVVAMVRSATGAQEEETNE